MNPALRKDLSNLLLLLCFAAVMFGFRLGSFGFMDPDEPFYALTAKEMFLRHDFSTPILFGHPQFEKPIFYYWVIYFFYGLFGVNELAARFGSALAGTLTLLITYCWARVLFKGRRIALISAFVLASAFQFVLLSRIVLTDIFLCFFVTGALFCFSLGYKFPIYRKAAWHGLFIFCAFGFLTKGPLGILLPFFGIISYLSANKEGKLLKEIPWFSGLFLLSVIALPWYVLMAERHAGFLKQFFLHENIRRFFVAEHKNFDSPLFYPGAVLLGFFPWTALVPGALYLGIKKSAQGRTTADKSCLFLFLCFFLMFAFFMFAKSKLLSYIFPVFPAVAIFTGLFIDALCRASHRPVLASVAAIFFAVIPALLAAGTAVYGAKNGIDLSLPCLGIGAVSVAAGSLLFFFILRKNYTASFFTAAAELLIFYSLVFGWLFPAAEDIFSSKNFVKAYEAQPGVSAKDIFLGSKLYVRGSSYYAEPGHTSVIISENPKGNFYTRHPLAVYSKTEDLDAIAKDSFPVYCFTGQKELRLLRSMAARGNYAVTVLRENPRIALSRLDSNT